MINDIIHGAGNLLYRKRFFALCMAFLFALAIVGSMAAYGENSSSDGEQAIPMIHREAHGKPLLAYAGNSLEEMAGPLEDRSFTVSVLCDNQTIPVTAAWGDSVEDIIDRSGVALGEEDQLSHMLHRPINPDDKIVVERWVRDTHTVQENIPFETVTVASSLLRAGKTHVVSQGTPGVLEREYERLLVNGKVTEQTLLSETMLSNPIPQKALVGQAGVPVSPLDFAWEFDENGVPVDYAEVISGNRAAGYSANPGALTASGRKAIVGHVAVNPNVIPYGSKLYITSSDGSFVYGYAIAADTGSALMKGIIDVDLFYGTYLESCLNAIRTVDIYILEYPEV